VLKGKTQSGFTFNISDERLNNYELLEALNDLEENPLAVSRVVNLLLGKESAQKLKNHVRTKDGLVPADKMTAEIKEIFEGSKQTKNS
jgi:hypothetical protein